MNVWTVFFSEQDFPEDLYQAGLVLLDDESQARIKRFYHRRDSYRCLLGRLLPHALLKQLGTPPEEIRFSRTPSGKPLVATPRLEQTIGFNISHDNAFVVMGFHSRDSGVQTVDAGDTPQTDKEAVDISTIGIDVMKIELPRYERSLGSFIQSISDTLTPNERHNLLESCETSGGDDGLGLQRLYMIWTLKEAYTKAIGFGLGFDFKRIEVDTVKKRVHIDDRAPHGWEFTSFNLERQGDQYQVAIARFTGDSDGGGAGVNGHVDDCGLVNAAEWLVQYDAASLIECVAK